MTLDSHFDALARVAGALAGELSLDDLLGDLVRAAREATGATYVALGVIGDDGTISRFVHTGMDDETVDAIGPLPTGRGILGLLIRHPETMRLDDLSSHPASVGFPEHHPPMKTFLGTPIRSNGQIYGNLYLAEKDGGFSPEDERLVEVLAAQAGAAIDNALLADKLQKLAVQAERERISRDLHDHVIQTLFSIGMGLESARGLVGHSPDRVAQRLDDAVDAIDTTIRDLRNTIFHLRADEAAALGLREGLVELAREHEVNALTRPSLDVTSDLDAVVPAAMVPDVLQVVRESLHNAAKHANASRIRVRVRHMDSHLEVAVIDDGLGFDPTEPSAGHGLSNVRERAELYGGTAMIESAPSEGTRILVRLPLE